MIFYTMWVCRKQEVIMYYKTQNLFLKWLVGLLFLVISIQMAYSTSSLQGKALQDKAKTLVYCSEASPSGFNPQFEIDDASFEATRPIFDTLVDFEYGKTNIIPKLAKRWTIDNKGLEYTFELREDVKFHATSYFVPTRNMNVDDVIFSFKRQMDLHHPYHKVSGGLYKFFHNMDMKSVIKDIIKIDNYKVKFILSRPNAPFLSNLTMPFTSIFSKEYADQMLQAKTLKMFDRQPIGTGPFVFKQYKKDHLIQYEAFPDYFDSQRGNIQNLIFSITPDASIRFQKLKANECQLIAVPAPEDLNAIKKDKNLDLVKAEGMNIAFLAINTQKPPFDNKLVRQAVHYALDKEAYIQSVYLGHAQKAYNPIPPTIWSYHHQVKSYDHNVQKAKSLIKKAGFAKGFKTDLWVLPISRPYLPSGKKLAEMMQFDLAQIGIQVKLVSYKWPTYLAKTNQGEHSLMQLGWSADNGDPDDFLYSLLSCHAIKTGATRAFWCHPVFDRLVSQARRIMNRQDRIQLYQKAQVIFNEEVPWIPIAYSTIYVAKRKNVVGYKISLIGNTNVFTYVLLH